MQDVMFVLKQQNFCAQCLLCILTYDSNEPLNMLKIYLILSFTISLASTCSIGRNTIRLSSSQLMQHFVQKGCTYTFIFDQPSCNGKMAYCTRDGKWLGDKFQKFNDTEVGFTMYFQDISDSGIYVCSLADRPMLCWQQYKVNIVVYVPPKDVQLRALEEMNQNLVSLTGPRITNYSCCSNGMTPPAEIVFFLEDELIIGSTATTVKKNQENSYLYDVCSYVEVLLSWEYDGKLIYCKVYYPQVDEFKEMEVIRKRLTLNVGIVFYHQSTLIQNYSVIEGSSLVLNCSSTYPFAASYSWKHVESEKVVASGTIMTITNITCHNAGYYVCTVKPDNDRNSTNVETYINVSCFPRPPAYVRVLSQHQYGIIFEWSPSPLFSDQIQYKVEWNDIDGGLLGSQILPIPDKSPPFHFIIEDVNISDVSLIGVYGENGETKSVKIYASMKNTDTPLHTNDKITVNDVVNITTPVIAVSSVALFFAGFLTAVCLYITKRWLRRFKKAKQSQPSAYMHYLPKQDDTTYQELSDVTAKQSVQKN